MNSPDVISLQARANKRINSHVPKHAWKSTVAIVIANSPSVDILGTGSLFQIADHPFVVTAAHVIGVAHVHHKTIGISGDSHSLISVHGDWTSSVSRLGEDPFDVAVYPLPATAVQQLSRFRFLRIDDISFDKRPEAGVFTLFGHPGIWSSPSQGGGEPLQSKGLEYTAVAYKGDVEALTGYQPKYHLLLDAQAHQVTWSDGSKATLIDQEGKIRAFPMDLGGISGCPVWRIGDLNIPLDKWHKLPPKVVGVGTCVCQKAIIRVTRWVAVTTLIDAAFPELRSAISTIR
jgi:hypothetical protein